jgi:hypothetical protein
LLDRRSLTAQTGHDQFSVAYGGIDETAFSVLATAIPAKAGSNCTTTCYNAGSQRVCNTHCY